MDSTSIAPACEPPSGTGAKLGNTVRQAATELALGVHSS